MASRTVMLDSDCMLASGTEEKHILFSQVSFALKEENEIRKRIDLGRSRSPALFLFFYFTYL